MVQGGCLCGAVRFELEAAEGEAAGGPLELCHCSRCRKATGSAFAAGLWVPADALHWIQGRERVRHFAAPILERPPAYRRCFCEVCGSPLPDPEPGFHHVEVPAGLLDDDPGARPDKHLLIGPPAPWFEIRDALPRLDRQQLTAFRRALWPSDGSRPRG